MVSRIIFTLQRRTIRAERLPISLSLGVGSLAAGDCPVQFSFVLNDCWPLCVSTALASGLCVVTLAVIVSLHHFLTDEQAPSPRGTKARADGRKWMQDL